MSMFRGAVSMLILSTNTIVAMSAVLPLAFVKLVAPAGAIRRPVDRLLNRIAELWIAANGVLLRGVRWAVEAPPDLSRKRWYLVEANHQSWADIFVLQKVLTGRIPLLKFFLKKELIWVPLIGLGWWALDFPFMKRHSREFLERHPERRGEDLLAIRRACEKFSLIPTAVMNFLEGTRFTPEKREAEGSPYRHLLVPRAGGIGLALGAMGERFHALLDVTIFYPHGAPSFFGMLAGRTREVVVRVRELPIPADLVGGDYTGDPAFRARTQQWVGQLWSEKDRMLEALATDA